MALATLSLLASGCSGGGGASSEVGRTEAGVLKGGGEEVSDGEIVARLTLRAPDESAFLLRGTIPVPPGTYVEHQHLQPLAVVDHERVTVPSQVEVVSRYPRKADGAAVVEVLAKVTRPPGVKPGDELTYEVALHPHKTGTMGFSKRVRDMLGEPGALLLSTRDVFGNEYRADLFRQVVTKDRRAKKLRRGQLVHEYRTHEVLMPVTPKTGPQGTLPHMMGVHSYVTTYDHEELFSLDLHVHNGMDGLDKGQPKDDALREIYFKDLRLRLPKGWKMLTCFPSLCSAEGQESGEHIVYPVVSPLANAKLHYMPQQARMARRLVIYREGNLAAAEALLKQEYLAFCQPGTSPTGTSLWSWWNAETARFFPQAHRLPDLDFVDLDAVRTELAARYHARRQQVATGSKGSYPLQSGALGWAQPWGVPYGGMTGGDEINIFDGIRTVAAASREGYLEAMLTSRCYMDRQPTALYSIFGEPTKYEDLLVTSGMGAPYVDCAFYIVPKPESDPFGFNDAPTFQTAAVQAQGLQPPYQSDLAGWSPIDIQHYIRYTRMLKVLAWVGNDSLAKDQLAAAAEIFRLGYHEYPNSKYGYTQVSGLKATMDHVAEFPGQGLNFQRSEGWGLDVAAAAYATGDEHLRARYYPWFQSVVRTVEDGQSTCTGNLMATPVGKIFDGKTSVRLVAHSSFADNALRGIRESVFAGRDDDWAQRTGELVVGSARALISPGFWDESAGKPWQYVGVGPADQKGDFCNAIPGWAKAPYLESGHYFCSFAYAYELTGDEEFLFRAAQMLNTGSLLAYLQAKGLDGVELTAALLALVQELPSS